MGFSDRERREQLGWLFARHYPAVLAYALRRAPRAVAEDVASETFVVALRRIEDVPEQGLPWLYGVARRVLANERRAQSRRDRLDLRLRDVDVPAWVDSEYGEAEALLAAITRLPEPEREAVMLTAWEGLSGAEAAAAAGCTRVALRARLYRARRHLAEVASAGNEETLPARRSAPITSNADEGCNVTERSR